MNHKNASVFPGSFKKITLFLLPIMAWFVWKTGVFSHLTNPAADDSYVIKYAREEMQTISNECWNTFFNPVLTSMDSIANVIRKNNQQTTDLVENWILSRPDFISGSVWLMNRKWPVRYTRGEIWKRPAVKNLPSERFNTVYQYFRQEESFQEKQHLKYYLGPVLKADYGFEAPVAAMGLVTNAFREVKMIEVRIECYELYDELSRLTGSKDQWMILNEAGNEILASDDNIDYPFKKVEQFSCRIEEDRVISAIPFPGTQWVLCRIHPKSSLQPNSGLPYIQLSIVFLLAVACTLCIAWLLSWWIDAPLNRLLRAANEIARGDFSIRVPVSGSKKLQQLATLINYMAEETERLLQMNVGGIISEKRKTETILRNIADGVIVTDAQNRLIVVNSAAEAWFGIRQKAVLKKTVGSVLRIKALASLFERLSEKNPRGFVEFNYDLGGDLGERIFHAHASQVFDEDLGLIGTVTIFRDITKAYEADKLKTELVSMVAHELKSPMTSIFGFSELLMEDDLTAEQRKEYAGVIMSESSRLTDLINKFLDLTRLEVGRTEIRMIPFDIPQLIDKMIETTRSQLQKKNIHIIKDVSGKLPFAQGDPDMIEQVVLNLLSNAIKYSPRNSRIGIEMKHVESRISISIIDNGYGIPKDALPNIFKKFYRVSETNEISSAEGSGLGLALAKEIVQHHGGNIEVKSKLGVGSVFSFSVGIADILENES